MLTNEHVLQAFEAAGAAGGVVYLSVPITSGSREIALMRELGITSAELHRDYESRWRSEVVQRNELDARAHAERLRARLPARLVVDPSRIFVKGWDQGDYNTFWISLMERYVRQLVAAPGWEYSKGARGEVSLAVLLKHPIAEVEGSALTPDDIEKLDRSAYASLVDQGWSDEQVRAYLPAMNYDTRPSVATSAASQGFDWLIRERRYQVKKFGIATDDAHTGEGLADDSWWWRQLTTYFHRSRVLGVDGPVGRQALAKFVATACALLESVIRVHGPLPPPGVPSGEINREER